MSVKVRPWEFRQFAHVAGGPADRVVMHRTMSCRAISFGQIHIRRQIERELKIPVLQIESDMADTRLWSDAVMKTQINAFLEMLA